MTKSKHSLPKSWRKKMIQVINLTKSFSKHLVLDSMNITISDGTIFGLIGINGAGKSTLMRIISGVTTPDSGYIQIDGKPLHDASKSRKDIFYLSDNPPHGNFTTFNQLYDLYNVFYAMNKDIFTEILNLFGLDPSITLSKQSKGMKRQGYLALAFATNAKYLLLDEVFDGLDPQARLKFRKYLMKEINHDRIIIISSHSLRELEDVCDSFGMIENGQFKNFGNIDETLSTLKKYRIILNDEHQPYLKDGYRFMHTKKEGRVVTLIENQGLDINNIVLSENILAIDKLDMTFEEYFIISQKEDTL